MVLPTKAKTEGYPGAIFESYAAGLPVITTPAGAIPEIVTEDTGVFVPPGDSEALYNAMRQLVDDQDTFQRLLDGVSAYRAEYDSRHWADYYVQLCRDLCNNQRG
jgi:glycosyltransferase involved in cell wall biosynthesis